MHCNLKDEMSTTAMRLDSGALQGTRRHCDWSADKEQ
jgi:hypothetical protein